MPSPIRLLSICLVSGLMLACGASDTSTTTPDANTLIAVDPTDFPAFAQCGDGKGSGAYVAELVDVSRLVEQDALLDIGEFRVQSSPATACNRAVAFSEAVANREYVVQVRTFADSDGDPSTIDVCTLDRTSVTVPRQDGVCSSTLAEATTLAQPLATIACYGWQASASMVEDGSAGSAASAASAGRASSTDSGARCNAQTRGCPGTALAYRTVKLRYCVESPY